MSPINEGIVVVRGNIEVPAANRVERLEGIELDTRYICVSDDLEFPAPFSGSSFVVCLVSVLAYDDKFCRHRVDHIAAVPSYSDKAEVCPHWQLGLDASIRKTAIKTYRMPEGDQ